MTTSNFSATDAIGSSVFFDEEVEVEN